MAILKNMKINDVEFDDEPIKEVIDSINDVKDINVQLNELNSELNKVLEELQNKMTLKNNSKEFYSLPQDGRAALLTDLDELDKKRSLIYAKLTELSMIAGYIDMLRVCGGVEEITITK